MRCLALHASILLTASIFLGCSSGPPQASGAPLDAAITGADGGADGVAADGVTADGVTDATGLSDAADSGSVADTADSGSVADTDPAVDAPALIDTEAPVEDVEPDNGLDPPDVPEDVADTGPQVPNGLGTLYAHTSGTLYRLDVAGFLKVGNFSYDKAPGSMTDIALNKTGTLFGVTFDDVFQCDKATAKCKWLASLPKQFNGLTFVPAGTVDPVDEVLIGVGNDGSWNRIDVAGSKATIKQLGYYGGGMTSSGDAFSVEGIGTFATVKKGFGGDDFLVSVNPKTGAATSIGNTGVAGLWGFAWYSGTFYGFSDDGDVWAIDVKTAKATPAKFSVPGGLSWWGAGVSTRANGVP